MDRFTSIFKLHQILKSHRRPVPMRVITERLECSRSTANWVIEKMRTTLGASLEYDRKARGNQGSNRDEMDQEASGLVGAERITLISAVFLQAIQPEEMRHE